MLASILLTILLGWQTHPATAGEKAPDFVLKDVSGHTVRLSDYRGKIVVINFWATWCAPCLAEMPELSRLQKDHRDNGLQVIGVTYGRHRPREVMRTVRKLKIGYPVVLAPKALASRYGVGEVLPVTIVVGRDGVIRNRFLGTLEPEEFEKIVEMVN